MAQATSKPGGGFRRRVGKLFMIIGALWTFMFVVGVIVAIVVITRKPKVPEHTVLELRLDRPLKEAPNTSSLASLLNPNVTNLPHVIRALDEGSKDAKVEGLIVYVGGSHGLATMQELRDAIFRFRKAGKFAIAFAPSFGEMAGGTGHYYLATACDEIWLQPSGSVGITGLRAEVPFLKGLLDNVGVQAEGQQRKAYKNAFNTFTQTEFTKPHKESMEQLLAEILEQLVTDVARERKLEVDDVKRLFAEGPFLAEAALNAKLIDHIGYRDQAVAAAKGKAGGQGKLLFAGKYLERAGKDDPEEASGDKLAVIYGVGTIMPGRGSVDPLSGEATMGADTIAAALRAAARDKDVKAVVFRIDSPGGSYVASDTIWRETVELRNTGKPLVVSMANVAASGGYFVAMNANKIVAEPATLTGSIGVYAFKMVTKDLWNKVGLSWGTVSTSDNAGIWSSLTHLSDSDQKRFSDWLDFVYADFTGKVASGRKLSAEAVEASAQGRVWTARKAKELGLVDALGGMETAIALAKEAAGIKADADVKLVAFPEDQGILRFLLDRNNENSDDVEAATWTVPWAKEAAAWSKTLNQINAATTGEPLLHTQTPQVR